MRYFILIFLLTCVLAVVVLGKRGSLSRKPPREMVPDMVRQPRLRPQQPNNFLPGGRNSLLPVAGTIARGAHYEDIPVNTGRLTGTTNFVETNPLPITEDLLKRGHQRYQISCSPCHGGVGDGNGVTKKFGMAVVANLHEKRIIAMPDGELFNTITFGKNLMGPYGNVIDVEDRWAIIAYLRALQLSRLGAIDDVPAGVRPTLGK